MSYCTRCNQGVDYCDCIPQKYRERIAQEIEAMKHTIVTIEGGISSHSLDECRSMRQQDYDLAQARYAAIARGQK